MVAKKNTDNAMALTAIEIAKELRNITDSIIEAGGECDDQTFAALKTWEASLEVKAENLCLVKSRLEADQAYYKQVEEAAKSRRKTAERTWDNLKKYLAHVMKESGTTKIKKNDGLFTLSLTSGRPSVVIDRQEALPMDLVEVVEVYKPKTDSIMAKLKAGQEVPGAHLEIGDDYVTIRMAGGNSKEE
jgi:hypothetical protein